MRLPRDDQPALITNAPQSRDDEFDHRRKRYAIMMALRAVCVIAAAVTYRVSWLLTIALIVGGTVLPWCAVLLANDRPPKRARRLQHGAGGSGERALPSGADDRTIEG